MCCLGVCDNSTNNVLFYLLFLQNEEHIAYYKAKHQNTVKNKRACTHKHAHTHTCMHTQACTHAYMHAHTRTHIRTHTHRIQSLGTHSVLSCRAGDCDFQTGFCQWTEDSSGTQQWVQGSGQSHTNNSAPLFDHDGSSTGNLLSVCMLVGGEGGVIVPHHQPCFHDGQIIMHSTGHHSIA